MPSANFKFLLFFILALQFVTTHSIAESRLAQVKKLKVVYSPDKDTLNISWDKVSGANKYLINLKDPDSNQVLSKQTTKNSVSFETDILIEGISYKAEIQALKNGSNKSSKIKKKAYLFTRKVPTEETTEDFKTLNSGNRSGQYYLPMNYRLKTLPLMIIFHGSGISGSNVLKLFRKHAKDNNFIIAAPDSSNPAGWDVPSDFLKPTEDQTHTYNLLVELYNLPHLNIDSEKILIVGISAGGAMSAFLGSSDIQFKKIAVLHGGIIINELGANRVPVWLATGTQDSLRTPSELMSYKTQLDSLGFPLVEYHEYDVGHQVLESEQTELLDWWLK